MKEIEVHLTHLELPDYKIGECDRLELSLSIYDPLSHTYNPYGYVYDRNHYSLKLPRGLDVNYVRELTGREVVYAEDFNNIKPKKAIFKVNKRPRDELQYSAIQFLIGAGKYRYTSKCNQLVLNIATGSGKTFCAVLASSYFMTNVIVICPTDVIKDVWKAEYLKSTSLVESEICDIKGTAQLNDYMNNPRKIKGVKIFIVNHATLRSFGNEYTFDKLDDLFNVLGIGLKIIDETHLRFQSILLIDSYTSVRKTIYLTATFGMSDMNEDRIYKKCFGSIPKFIQRNKGEFSIIKKNSMYLSYIINTNPTQYILAKCTSKYGFNINAYSKYECSIIDDMIDYMTPILQKFVLNDVGYKTLITIASIEGCELLKYKLAYLYKDLDIDSYHSKKDKREKESILENADVIISTIKSLGVGVNIPNLRCIINLEAFRSLPLAEQLAGRLRPLADGNTTIMVDIVDYGFPNIRYHYKRRLKLYETIFDKCFSIKA